MSSIQELVEEVEGSIQERIRKYFLNGSKFCSDLSKNKLKAAKIALKSYEYDNHTLFLFVHLKLYYFSQLTLTLCRLKTTSKEISYLKEDISDEILIKIANKEISVKDYYEIKKVKQSIRYEVPLPSNIVSIVTSMHTKLKHRGRDAVYFELKKKYFFTSKIKFSSILLFKLKSKYLILFV